VLERIALHQTRLHTPGLGLDSKGVALGAKGMVLLPSIDRLVALLSVYTRERSLEDLIAGLAMHVVRSKLGTREVTFEFVADSSDRMDRIADTARLVGGFTFTGTSRHFVQYRDAAAPFGYDATQLLPTDAAVALYGDRFTQTYDFERTIDLRALLLRLMPRIDPSTKAEPGPRILVAEAGLGPALVHYLIRSRVDGQVCAAEWPPASAFEDAPIRRWMMRIPDLPQRMHSLVHATPGITCFVPVGPAVAVEAGFRHPVELRACPVFDPAGLVLLRGRGDEPWEITRVPPMGELGAFAPVEMRTSEAPTAIAKGLELEDRVRVPLRVVPSSGPWRNVTATWIPAAQIPLLRRLAYSLPQSTLAGARVAVTDHGAFVRCAAGIDAIPLGTFFTEVHRNLYLPAGHDVAPAVTPELLARALGAAEGRVVFVGVDAQGVAVQEGSFMSLESALLQAPPWEPVVAAAIEDALSEAPIDLKVSSIGMRPTRGVRPPPTEA